MSACQYVIDPGGTPQRCPQPVTTHEAADFWARTPTGDDTYVGSWERLLCDTHAHAHAELYAHYPGGLRNLRHRAATPADVDRLGEPQPQEALW